MNGSGCEGPLSTGQIFKTLFLIHVLVRLNDGTRTYIFSSIVHEKTLFITSSDVGAGDLGARAPTFLLSLKHAPFMD